ncbi:MAG: hypothetical protein ABR612_06575 [Chromatocurvus sp.]
MLHRTRSDWAERAILLIKLRCRRHLRCIEPLISSLNSGENASDKEQDPNPEIRF